MKVALVCSLTYEQEFNFKTRYIWKSSILYLIKIEKYFIPIMANAHLFLMKMNQLTFKYWYLFFKIILNISNQFKISGQPTSILAAARSYFFQFSLYQHLYLFVMSNFYRGLLIFYSYCCKMKDWACNFI